MTVAEVNRTAARSIGLNFSATFGDGNGVGSFVGNIFSSTFDADGALPGTTPLNNIPVMLDNGGVQLAIHALRRLSLAKTLAEPTLTTLNGKQARFQAGGQFPVPVVTGSTNTGLQGVSFVPFGVSLQFTPYVIDRDHIRLVVKAEVSARNAEISTTIGTDSNVPGLDTRNFETTVEMRDGQTLVVAGLLKTDFGSNANRVPFFGDLPIIGRAAAYDFTSAGEQELVILVTPELVQPIDPHEAPPLPGSDVYEPGDVEFYLGAHLEGIRSEDYRSPVRTDLQRMKRYEYCNDKFIIGPSGYSCGLGTKPVIIH